MRIIFFGNTKYSLIGAKIIHNKLGIAQIVTLPDRPDKRGILKPNPLKTFALEKNIPFLTTDKLDEETINHIPSLQADFLIVEDYGLILPKKLLDSPQYASINIHHSLLPKYRGPSPAPAAILAGDTVTGVTVIKMAEKVDTGDILGQKEYEMKPAETTDSLLTELNQLGGELAVAVIDEFQTGKVQPKQQNESQATYTTQFTKQDGFFDITNPPPKEQLDRMIRAYYPWPTTWTKMEINGKEKVVKFLPGNKLQVEGGNPMSLKDFINGYPELREKLTNLLGS